MRKGYFRIMTRLRGSLRRRLLNARHHRAKGAFATIAGVTHPGNTGPHVSRRKSRPLFRHVIEAKQSSGQRLTLGAHSAYWPGGTRPAADLRAAGDTVSYREFSASHKLAFMSSEPRVFILCQPWKMAGPGSIRCQISFTIAKTFTQAAGLGYDQVLHLILHYATALLAPSRKRAIIIHSNSKLLCG